MNFSVREIGYSNDLWDVTINSGSATITECCYGDELTTIAREILQDVVLRDCCWGYETIQKLIALDIISHEQVLQYVKDNEGEI